MSSLPSSRITRRLLKLASLGLAGFIAGLLSGCDLLNLPEHAAQTPYYLSDTADFDLPGGIDANPVPTLHHPPSARRLEREYINTNPPTIPNRRNGL